MTDAGSMMPDITMETPDGGSVKPSDFEGQKLVLFFYPKDNTPGCTNEAKDFSALKADFEKAGATILGISKCSPKKHQNFIAKHELTVALATDAEEGGLSDELGIWTEKTMYGKTYMGMVRTTYLVDESGKIAQVWPKVKVKGHADEVLAAVQAL
ncbi:peroxiredoxin [Pontixanthobacter aestiaquae]|uniref:thioredoxin-dependent peroxiredoxin n=1 Tax=Pontixanthobacter aestiaquae TaxID=1509367 RepID=A0A844Z3E8_9SPHN|nr:peroxiredoxin [Pontixanthobacter aestiaquae]MDN3646759.1 peroxiredoxin [Pontixanthobacter aestiaquae]MXO82258.1 redoxin domain-containing protein [Pontixanthobacter aestiaquae]